MEHMGDDLNFLCIVGSNDVCWGRAVMGEVFKEWIDLKLMGMGPRGARQKRAEFTTFKMYPASGLQAFP